MSRIVVALAALVWVSGCGGQVGCINGGTAIEYPAAPPPEGVKQRDAMVLRLEKAALQFVFSHLSDVLRDQTETRTVGGIERAVVYLPESGGSLLGMDVVTRDGCIGAEPWDACSPGNGPVFRSLVELNLSNIDQSITTEFEPPLGNGPESLLITLSDFDIFVDIALAADGDAACRLHDSAVDVAAFHIEKLTARINIEVDASQQLQLTLVDVTLETGTTALSIDVDPCNGGACVDPACTGMTCAFTCSLLGGGSALASFLSPMLEDAARDLASEMIQQIIDDLNGQQLAAAAEIDVATLLADQGLENVVQDPEKLYLGSSPNADTFRVDGPADRRGLSTVFDEGAFALVSSCAPTVAVPDFSAGMSPLPFFDGRLTFPDHVEAYHAAFALGESYADQLAFAIYRGGAMCLRLTSDDLEEQTGTPLTLGALALVAPEVEELGDPNAPLIIEVHPTRAPDVSFGDASETDPLIRVDFGEIGLTFYAYVDGAFLRLATVATDVHMDLALTRTPENVFELALSDLAILNLAQVYNEISPGTDFASIVETLLDLALGQMLGGLGGFKLDLAPAISQALGGAPIYGRINDIRTDGATERGYLSIYFTFCDAYDVVDPSNTACYTPPSGASMWSPRWMGGGHWRLARAGDVPRFDPVRIEVPAGREAQVRVDGRALWTAFRMPEGNVLSVDHPALRWPGEHRIEIRTRAPGNPMTLDRVVKSLGVTTR